MEMTVSGFAIVMMAVACVCAFIIPIVLFIYYRKKGADILPFFIGCAVFFLFALVIESMFHQLILVKSPVGATIQNNIWLFALYGGLMAGLFEETGRFVAFKTVLKKYRGNDKNALMYGAGHGGFEVIAVLGLTMIGNIYLSVLANTGMASSLMANAPAEYSATLQSQVDAIAAVAPPMFLLGIVERIFAVTVHIAFSVIVWFAVKKGRTVLYTVAILFHALLDGITVIVSKSHIAHAEIVTEICVGVLAVAIAFFAWKVWVKYSHSENVDEEKENEKEISG